MQILSFLLQGQSIEVTNNSLLKEVIKTCLEKAGSNLHDAFTAKYLQYLDVCIPTMQFLEKQVCNTKPTFSLMIAMPQFDDLKDTFFV